MIEEQREYPYMEIDPLNLRISPELVGASLEFELDNCQLQFRFPAPSNAETLAPRTENFRRGLPDNGLLVCGWLHGEPVAVKVEYAYLVFLDSPELKRYRVDPELGHDQLVCEIREVSKRAVKLLLRVLRWKSRDALNGRTFAYDFNTDSTEAISIPPVRKRTGASVNRLGTHNSVTPTLDMHVWKATERCLRSGEEPPLAFDLFSDAVYLGESRDYRRAYLELAMAAEVHIRTRIENTLPSSLDPHMRKEIRRINYSKLLEVFFKQLSKEEREALTGEGGIKSDLKRLSEDRNIIVHQGGYMRSKTTDKAVEFSHKKFSVYRDAVERLLNP